ncbi:type II toxin-antitoxin system death-on-curing family toxin [Escherichia coli O128:H42]|uniref:type II toxin-antitoxin system death-on-curing family toxin n=1 Tax=Escherichia coli TaxID=562 RepID=UPI0002CAD7BC|nr:type II toxin-antitoxin system death-on-curing family toxin [Escherichia coli]EFA4142975.1 type II toxin-antitoxin system death-on-curing family toxin [Escherichia coli O78:H42]EFA4190287.1 type II toxin-antitoxin system death-on-curing family toxin [Escherichia coli O128:H42]EFA4219335.1 type II toxin-antitoxin system death-on-curing family toxin [Escherichia coli O19:H42]EEU9537719.1 type II toxin-antitoxin system death-on-curing family toxin [Escherichia coli]EEV6660320.1 type II toxin-a
MAEIVEGVHYLTVDDLVEINRSLIELQTPDEPVGVLSPDNLSSSQARPSMVRWYEQINDMFVLASVLIESLIQNHPFANANKRTAMMAGYVFLLLNGYELTAPGDEIVEMAEGLACKTYTREDLENWLCYWSRAYDSRELCKTGATIVLYETIKLKIEQQN